MKEIGINQKRVEELKKVRVEFNEEAKEEAGRLLEIIVAMQNPPADYIEPDPSKRNAISEMIETLLDKQELNKEQKQMLEMYYQEYTF